MFITTLVGEDQGQLRLSEVENDLAVVILCGGKGSHIYASQGFRRFVLAAGHRKEMLYDYFEGRFTDWRIDILDTGLDADTGDRFFATYGDGLGDVDLHAMLDFHQQKGGLATDTAVPLRSQYGTVQFNPARLVESFSEKPILKDYWINAGFFVFEKAAAEHWHGHNLESEVLPGLAAEGKLYTHLHHGFWKSMDTSKDQQELQKLISEGTTPWTPPAATSR